MTVWDVENDEKLTETRKSVHDKRDEVHQLELAAQRLQTTVDSFQSTIERLVVQEKRMEARELAEEEEMDEGEDGQVKWKVPASTSALGGGASAGGKKKKKGKESGGGLPYYEGVAGYKVALELYTLQLSLDGANETARNAKRAIASVVVNKDQKEKIYFVPKGKHINVNEGDVINKGDLIVDGQPTPQDILEVLGKKEFANYMVNEVQEVYRLQGVNLNDKHIEVIVRQMLKKISIVDSGDSTFLPGETVFKDIFDETNKKLEKNKKKLAQGKVVLMGITKAAIQTKSFISAASFQETTRVLTDAAIKGKVDRLEGLKENVIVGRLVPAGTGATKIKWQKIANERDALLVDQSSKELKEKQFSSTQKA